MSAPAAARPPLPATGAPALREVADGVLVYEQPDGGWCLNNAGVITGGGRCILVDTVATRPRAERLRDEVARVAPGGPDTVVNTHFHGDHVFGNSLFTPRATVIAHEGTRSDMAESGLGLCGLWPDVDWGEITLALPDLTFTERLTLRAGELRVELLSVGPAHTAADVVVWVPERRVLFTGDVVWSQVTPYVLMGSVSGSLRALERLRALEPRIVVPGHGPVAGPEALDATEDYLRWVAGLARDGLRAGRTPLETARATELGRFAGLVDPERLVGNLHRAHAEASGLPPGARLDVAASFREMVAHLGRLPDCHA
ncbi:MBL fold metallo-hydrolase [Streptomyces angustmyceticus]|uniref:MBL fold metallo-hydrolase n=1 Tax=Streptomyces angustmyceticus TaxID=285578 RepID=A0A5J4LPW5_9ACTN|nr:MBL fold metallo-hydrolase [Streptomyces angustmyceticus]GES33529.1 MBL fold metallo-hydrolase [Streptomyces angustmyceticus]